MRHTPHYARLVFGGGGSAYTRASTAATVVVQRARGLRAVGALRARRPRARARSLGNRPLEQMPAYAFGIQPLPVSAASASESAPQGSAGIGIRPPKVAYFGTQRIPARSSRRDTSFAHLVVKKGPRLGPSARGGSSRNRTPDSSQPTPNSHLDHPKPISRCRDSHSA